jgi:uncharacterized protein YwgA
MKTENITNEDVVLAFAKKATEYQGTDNKGIHGKKALQKSMYFLNEKFHLFGFRWGDYGPLSGEIQQIAEDLIARGNITVKNVPTKKDGIFIQQMEYCAKDDSYFEELSLSKDLDSELNEVVKFTAGKSPRDLELLASVHYWAKRQQELLDEYSVDYVLEKLTELKPDAGFKQSDVENAIDTLETHEYLSKD